MIEGEVRDRLAEGRGILDMELAKVEGGAELVLGALKGFRRDLSLTVKSHEKNIDAEFGGFIAELSVPRMETGANFTDLEKMVTLAEKTIEGKIKVKAPKGFERDERKSLIQDLEGTHKNLVAVVDMARDFFEIIKNACKEFDMFNGNNMNATTRDADIVFDRDALNISMETARAISERAVRLDIDLVAQINELKADE